MQSNWFKTRTNKKMIDLKLFQARKMRHLLGLLKCYRLRQATDVLPVLVNCHTQDESQHFAQFCWLSSDSFLVLCVTSLFSLWELSSQLSMRRLSQIMKVLMLYSRPLFSESGRHWSRWPGCIRNCIFPISQSQFSHETLWTRPILLQNNAFFLLHLKHLGFFLVLSLPRE